MTPTFHRLSALAAAVLALAGCSSGECRTNRAFFERDVWAKFMGTQCFKCHSPDGVAVSQKSKFVLQPSTYPGFLDANLGTIGLLAKLEYDGTPTLLLKPVGKLGHGGGKVLEEDSDDYAALVDLLDRVKAGETCTEAAADDATTTVTLLTPAQTLRKAALHLGARLPTAAELASVKTGGEAALDTALEGLTKEPAFLDRLMEGFNDQLLTDKYAWAGYPNAIYDLNQEDFPGAKALRDEWEHRDQRYTTDADKAAYQLRVRAQNDAVGRQPLLLMRYVVEHDRPFTEILTANYVVADDALAAVFDVKDGKTGVREAKLLKPDGTVVPQAGVLSTPAFLNRWPTTPTNRSRARARVVLRTFLATDILKLADRPIDITQVTQKDNPTMNAEQCTVCHRIIDPIAGGFRNYVEQGDYERFEDDREWHGDMFHPGFSEADLPSADYGAALPWLAQQVAADARFDLSAVQLAYGILTGRAVLAFPAISSPTFDADLKAWEAQQAELQGYRRAYLDSGRRFRPLAKAVLLGRTYRAARVKLDAQRLGEVEHLGTARLLAPEVLNRKIPAVLGVSWRQAWDWKNRHDWLDDRNLAQLYGGIDSDQITDRATALNGVMSNLVWRLSSETACLAVPYDFAKKQEDRLLFRSVRNVDLPLSAGDPVPAAIARIRTNIRELHARLLGEELAEGDPELEATYQLFFDTWKEGFDGEAHTKRLDWPCGLDPTTGEALPDELRRDDNYSLRAWMAVVAYLLADYRFLYE